MDETRRLARGEETSEVIVHRSSSAGGGKAEREGMAIYIPKSNKRIQIIRLWMRRGEERRGVERCGGVGWGVDEKLVRSGSVTIIYSLVGFYMRKCCVWVNEGGVQGDIPYA